MLMRVNRDSGKGMPDNNERRKVLKKLTMGAAAVVGCSVLPTKWTSPVVEFGALPAHAVTSGMPVASTEVAPVTAPASAAAPAPAAASSGREKGVYHGRFNGNRPTWYLGKTMGRYPQQFTVVIDGCGSIQVTSNNGHRFSSGSIVVKQSDVPGRGMAVVGSPACGSRSCYIEY